MIKKYSILYLTVSAVLLFVSVIKIYPQELWHLYNSSNSIIDETNLFSLALDSSQVVWLGERLSLYRFINGKWEKDFSDAIDDRWVSG